MSTPMHQRLDAALADLRVQQARISTAAGELAKATETAASKDRTIEATVDSQGKLTAIKLKGVGYRKLAPAEFAARIVDTIRSAQDAAGRRATEALAGLLPPGLGLGFGPDLLSGGSLDIDGMFESAVRAAREPLFADKAADPRKEPGHG